MSLSRRTMLQSAAFGFGHLAFQALSNERVAAAAKSESPAKAGLAARTPSIAPRAKRVLFLCMSGGPAQADTFDYKPQTGNKKHAGSVYPFRQRGESGLWI